MGERSGNFFLQSPPYTNRGVIRQKEELSALIDWCQITIKEVPLEAVIEDVLKIPVELMTVTGYEKGIAGHEVVAIFDIYQGTKTDRKCAVSRISDSDERKRLSQL